MYEIDVKKYQGSDFNGIKNSGLASGMDSRFNCERFNEG